ncbi:MAG: tol-pal system protein YbgF [Nitrospirae bacterium]|nr:MAG: tol-pal system protein YbgF [Nitrospirota bacterium]
MFSPKPPGSFHTASDRRLSIRSAPWRSLMVSGRPLYVVLSSLLKRSAFLKTEGSQRWAWWLIIIGLFFPPGGCVAQQADLLHMKRELEAKISSLHKQRQALEAAVAQANQALTKTQAVIARQRKELNKLHLDRAEFFEELASLREQEFSTLQGELERTQHHVHQLVQQIERLQKEAEARHARVLEQERDNQQRLITLEKTIELQTQELAARHTQGQQFQEALREFRQAMLALQTHQQDQAQHLEQLDQQVQGLTQKVSSDSEEVSAYLHTVNQSLQSIVDTIQQVQQKSDAQLTAQARRLEQVEHWIQHSKTHLKGATPSNNPSSALSEERQTLAHKERAPRQAVLPDVEALPHQSSSSAISPLSKTLSPQVKEEYRRIYEQVRAGQYRRGVESFTAFLGRYPDSPLAANAQYWLGECYYGMRQFSRAITEFHQVITRYPTSEKVPAALLKIAYSYLELHDPLQARTTLRHLIRAYPRSPEATLASTKLTEVDHLLHTNS